MFLQVMEVGEEEDSQDELFSEELMPDDVPQVPDFLEEEDLPVEEQIRNRRYYTAEQDLYFSEDGVVRESYQENAAYMPPTRFARYTEVPDYGYNERYEELHEHDVRNQQLQNAPEERYEEFHEVGIRNQQLQNALEERYEEFHEVDIRNQQLQNAPYEIDERDAQLYDEEDAELYGERDVNVERYQSGVRDDIVIRHFPELPKEVTDYFMKVLAYFEEMASNQRTHVTAKTKWEKAPMYVLISLSTEADTTNENHFKAQFETILRKIRASRKLNADDMKEHPFVLFVSFPNCTIVLKLMPANEGKSVSADDEKIQQLSMIRHCKSFFDFILKTVTNGVHTKEEREATLYMMNGVMNGKVKLKTFFKFYQRMFHSVFSPEVMNTVKTGLPLLRKFYAERGLCGDVKEQEDTAFISVSQTQHALKFKIMNCMLQAMFVAPVDNGGVKPPCTIETWYHTD